jgi:hypothetical protein
MIAALKKEIDKKRNYEYVLNLYKKCQHFCRKINNHFYEEDLINAEDKTYLKKKTFWGKVL